MNMEIKSLKPFWWIYAVGIFLIFSCVFYIGTSDNSFKMGFSSEDFTPIQLENENTILKYTTSKLCLEPGNYQIKFHYQANEPGSIFQIYNTSYVQEDNSTDFIVDSVELNPADSKVVIDFTLTGDMMSYIQFRIQNKSVYNVTVIDAELSSPDLVYHDGVILLVIVFLSLLFITGYLMFYRKKIERNELLKREFIFFLLTFSVLFVSLPLFTNFMFYGHDIYFHLSRIEGIKEGLRSGQFPVRIHPHLMENLGVGNSIFYPDFFLYFPALLRLFGVSALNSYKIFSITIQALTALIAYFSYKGLSKSRKIALVSTLFYMFSIYRLVDWYTRAAVGEALAMAFFPLAAYGLYEIIKGDEKKWVWAVVGFSGIIQSHVLSIMMSGIFALLFTLVNIRSFKNIRKLISLGKAAVVTLLLNLWFLFPLLDHYRYPYNAFNSINETADYGLYPDQIFSFLISTPNGINKNLGNAQHEMPFSLGFFLLIGILLFLGSYYLYQNKRKSHAMTLGKYSLILGGIAIYLSSYLFPWKTLMKNSLFYTLANALQFPWRFLAVASVFLCLTAAIGYSEIAKTKAASERMLSIGALLALTCASVYLNAYFDEAGSSFVKSHTPFAEADSLYLLESTDMGLLIQNNNQLYSNNERLKFTQYEKHYCDVTFHFKRLNEESDTYVDVPLNFYPNYIASLDDGTALHVIAADSNLVRVFLPNDVEEGTVHVYYKERTLYILCNWISGLTCLIFLGSFAYLRIIKPRRKKLF